MKYWFQNSTAVKRNITENNSGIVATNPNFREVLKLIQLIQMINPACAQPKNVLINHKSGNRLRKKPMISMPLGFGIRYVLINPTGMFSRDCV